MQDIYLKIALDTPLDKLLDYRWTPFCSEKKIDNLQIKKSKKSKKATFAAIDSNEAINLSAQTDSNFQAELPLIGQLVTVPFGRQRLTGMIIEISSQTKIAAEKLKNVEQVHVNIKAFTQDWLALMQFCASYYHQPLGVVIATALPTGLRDIVESSLERQLKKLALKQLDAIAENNQLHTLNAQQLAAVSQIQACKNFTSFLLHGVTGSGKTEVYLQSTAQVLSHSEQAQVLILVPEIHLTPQLYQHFAQRFGEQQLAVLHSGLSHGERLQNWLAVHYGKARVIVGTRLAVLASIPNLQLIIVDEEHDLSYKQQDGIRYSARDLAIWRAKQCDIPIVLGSATPSLETWFAARQGRYQKITLTERAVKNASLPTIKLIDTRTQKLVQGFSPTLLKAMQARLQAGQQSLLFLNRRGYAPVIHCESCGWLTQCPHCSVYMVWHKEESLLRCHHCGYSAMVPQACPTCGDPDLKPLGRGTERVAEHVRDLFPTAKMQRIDADTARNKKTAQAIFAAIHSGQIDILVGTQMIAKGHDFRYLTLVGILNADAMLFHLDYRASERLFAQLMQVAGRAGRSAQDFPAEVFVQTRYPEHPLYQALVAHDYAGFANQLLAEREQALLPPFLYQAILRAESKEMQSAIQFLQQVQYLERDDIITLNQAVPMPIAKKAGWVRAQLLIESPSRRHLQAFLKTLNHYLRNSKTNLRWSLELDPSEI